MAVVLPALAAGAAFALAALPGVVRHRASAARGVAVVLAAGILLAVAVVELVPESLELAGPERAPVALLAGFAVLFSVEVLTRGHTHHDVADHAAAHHAAGPFLAGLLVHNLVDGAAIGSGAELSAGASAGVSLGILLHQVPVGLSFAAVAVGTGLGRRGARLWALVLAAAIPVGAGVVAALPAVSGATLGVLLAASAGALVYIAAGHLLPEAQAEHASRRLALLFPAALALTTLLFLAVLPAG